MAASIFLEMAKNVHIPRKTDNARFSMKIEDIKKLIPHRKPFLFIEECKIIEIQYGDKVEETDIERLYYFNSKD